MQGYKIEFRIFAESQEQADAVGQALGRFVDDRAKEGIAVSADKMLAAVARWGKSPIIRNYFR